MVHKTLISRAASVDQCVQDVLADAIRQERGKDQFLYLGRQQTNEDAEAIALEKLGVNIQHINVIARIRDLHVYTFYVQNGHIYFRNSII